VRWWLWFDRSSGVKLVKWASYMMQKYWLGQVLTSVFPTTYDLEPLAVFFPDIFVSIVLPCVFNGQTMNIQNVQRAIPTLIVVDCCVHRSTPRIYLVVCFCSPHSYEILMTDKCFAAIYFLETTRAWKFVTINFLHDYLFSKVFHSNKRQVVCKDNLRSFSYIKKNPSCQKFCRANYRGQNFSCHWNNGVPKRRRIWPPKANKLKVN